MSRGGMSTVFEIALVSVDYYGGGKLCVQAMREITGDLPMRRARGELRKEKGSGRLSIIDLENHGIGNLETCRKPQLF